MAIIPHLNRVYMTGKPGQTSKNTQASKEANYDGIGFSKEHRYLTSLGVNHFERLLLKQMGLSSRRLRERSVHKALALSSRKHR